MPVLSDIRKGLDAGFHGSLSGRPQSKIPPAIAEQVGSGIGTAAGWVAGDKARRFVWLHNHPLGTQASIGYGLGDAVNKRLGAQWVHPAVVASGLSLGALPVLSGNVNPFNIGEGGRVAGYSAVFPDYEDPTKTTNSLAEFGARYFLGRKGKLLTPSQGFFEERPDVTPEQYAQYQHDLGYMGKSFFGLEDNRLLSTAIGTGLGSLAGAGPGHLVDSLVYKEKLPPGVGKRSKIGAIAGALAGSLLPEIAQTGFIKGGNNLSGVPTVQQLGYEVPLPALGTTLALATAFRYGIPALARRGKLPGYSKGAGQLQLGLPGVEADRWTPDIREDAFRKKAYSSKEPLLKGRPEEMVRSAEAAAMESQGLPNVTFYD